MTDNENLGVKDFVEGILSEIGCGHKTDANENIEVNYKGKKLKIEVNGKLPQFTIHYMSWANIEKKDPNARILLKAINESNLHSFVTTVYTEDPSGKLYILHNKMATYLSKDAENPTELITQLIEYCMAKADMTVKIFQDMIKRN
ncbi:MAG TPA: hypothetical protein PLB70_05150 [Paludibacteraceae bacterium]|nr:hypothetical protein [Paludibacteraceae bacterium]HQJ89982.1 hypothetical protein [Paludibacteraceae bacterium]